MKIIQKILFILSLAGIDLVRAFYFFSGIPKYFRDFIRYKSASDWEVAIYPCLHDARAQSATLGEYFWQDTYVARKIIALEKNRHIDVGSRIDGFISILASAQPVEVFDIRPLKFEIENVKFRQWDITVPTDEIVAADSVSCLHTIEHIGLGRYGDRIDPEGWKSALINLISLLKEGGVLWLSVPVGAERVEFNAHRVFSPLTINSFLKGRGMELVEFSYVDSNGLHVTKDAEYEMSNLKNKLYALGVFCYKKGAGGV